MSLTYTIQGFDLHQPEIGFKLLQATSFAPPVNPRRVVVEIPGMHGQLPLWDDELSAQKLTLKVRIQDRDPAQLQAKWEHLRALMWTGSNTGLTVRRVMGEQVTSCFAQLEAMDEPEFWSAAGMVDTVILLNIPYGRWEDIHTEEQQLPVSGDNIQIPFVAESTAPISGALIRVEGPTSSNYSLRIRDETNQTGFHLSSSSYIQSDYFVLIDLETGQVWDNEDDPSWDARNHNISSRITPYGNGMLRLVSNPGFQLNSRTTNVSILSSGMSGATITIQGRRTYL